jgi:hypothetical protein
MIIPHAGNMMVKVPAFGDHLRSHHGIAWDTSESEFRSGASGFGELEHKVRVPIHVDHFN